jgi:outer membrane biogenesis lipoprotein LolB
MQIFWRATAAILMFVSLLSGCTQTGPLRRGEGGPDAGLGKGSSALKPMNVIGSWSGRFSVKVDRIADQETRSSLQDSAQGQFSLTSEAEQMTLELSSPLGQIIAVIRSTPKIASLTLSDGKRHEAESAQSLLESQLGWRIPIDRLPLALQALDADFQPVETKALEVAGALGPDWSAQLSELDSDRTRLNLTWSGLSRNVTKLALTLIIDPRVGVSTNLRR